jgi:hypothetical protein
MIFLVFGIDPIFSVFFLIGADYKHSKKGMAQGKMSHVVLKSAYPLSD